MHQLTLGRTARVVILLFNLATQRLGQAVLRFVLVMLKLPLQAPSHFKVARATLRQVVLCTLLVVTRQQLTVAWFQSNLVAVIQVSAAMYLSVQVPRVWSNQVAQRETYTFRRAQRSRATPATSLSELVTLRAGKLELSKSLPAIALVHRGAKSISKEV